MAAATKKTDGMSIRYTPGSAVTAGTFTILSGATAGKLCGIPTADIAANLASAAQVTVTYQASIEQLLVLLPQAAATAQGIVLANRDTLQPYRGAYMSFNLSLNQPPPCTITMMGALPRSADGGRSSRPSRSLSPAASSVLRAARSAARSCSSSSKSTVSRGSTCSAASSSRSKKV